MYFDAAEQKIQDLDTAVTALQNAEPPTVDLTPLLDRLTALESLIAQHENRLDAMSLAAQG